VKPRRRAVAAHAIATPWPIGSPEGKELFSTRSPSQACARNARRISIAQSVGGTRDATVEKPLPPRYMAPAAILIGVNGIRESEAKHIGIASR